MSFARLQKGFKWLWFNCWTEMAAVMWNALFGYMCFSNSCLLCPSALCLWVSLVRIFTPNAHWKSLYLMEKCWVVNCIFAYFQPLLWNGVCTRERMSVWFVFAPSPFCNVSAEGWKPRVSNECSLCLYKLDEPKNMRNLLYTRSILKRTR